MENTYTSKINWKTYRISCRIEKDADDTNYVWIRGQVNGKDILASNHLNERKNISDAMRWMMAYSLPAYLDGHHHETHYPEGFFS
jgi:hypothetical protein